MADHELPAEEHEEIDLEKEYASLFASHMQPCPRLKGAFNAAVRKVNGSAEGIAQWRTQIHKLTMEGMDHFY